MVILVPCWLFWSLDTSWMKICSFLLADFPGMWLWYWTQRSVDAINNLDSSLIFSDQIRYIFLTEAISVFLQRIFQAESSNFHNFVRIFTNMICRFKCFSRSVVQLYVKFVRLYGMGFPYIIYIPCLAKCNKGKSLEYKEKTMTPVSI